jgi:predicted RND superfamily exporter protein
VVNLVVALGLAIDYVLHFVRAFLHASGAGRERVVEAMRSVGVPIFAGGLSTLVAVSPLGGSDSSIFVTFFQLLMSTVGSGLFSGLVMIPSILSFMPQRALNV